MDLIRLGLVPALLICCGARVAAAKSITVAADGSGEFKMVQEAVAAVTDNSAERTVIHIKPGTYQGQIVVPRSKALVTFEGVDALKTVLTFGYNMNEENPRGVERRYWGVGVVVLGDDFRAEKVTFQNTSGDHGQANALRIDGDRAVLKNCHMLGWQDTLRVESGRQYFVDCCVEGRVDFIYGSGTAVFDRCTIHSKNGGYVTAASTPGDHAFGFVFMNCKLTGDDVPWNPMVGMKEMKISRPNNVAYLGRPWRPYGSVTFVNCEMGDHIRPEGWNNWGKASNEQTARYAEYNSTGPGANPEKRVKWSRQMSKDEADKITVKSVLQGTDQWDPAR
jgi:pectinesterase